MNRLPHLLTVPLLLVVLLGALSAEVRALEPSSIVDFQPVAPGEGWLLLTDGDGSAKQLYWTSEDGASWRDITPPVEAGETVQAVAFANANLGRALLGGGTGLALAITTDGGLSWQRQSVDLAGLAGSPAPPVGVYMGWRGDLQGWLVFKLPSGSSFSLGLLYVTEDGGLTWQQRTVPLGEPVTFADENTGWTAGGPAGDALYRTADGGQSWDAWQPAGENVHYVLPKFDDARNGLLPVVVGDEGSATAEFYQTGDGGGTWSLVGSQPLPEDTPVSNDLPLTMLDSVNFVLVVPGADQMLRSSGLQLESIANADGASAAISALKMVSLDAGWARADSGTCSPAPDGSLACARETKLLSTYDSGLTWQSLPLPNGGETSLLESFAVADKSASPDAISPLDADTQPYAGQGFDKCSFPSVASMQTWWNSSPYNGFNLYIGGSKFACRSLLWQLTPSYVSSLSAQGWRFFPTWVGPQAPCMSGTYGSSGVFSYDTATAYSQGVGEANAALAAATNLGLAAPDGSGTVIYYDLETYGTDTSCRNAANSFISGWTHRLRERGNLAGVYGNAYYNAADWWNIANRPDAVWLAQWYLNPAYRPTASVWDVSLSSSMWPNHQRLRQYAGDHGETWGGVAFGSIDSNVLDGPVTVQNGTANTAPPSTPIAALPLPGASLPRNSDIWLTWKTTGDTCNVHVWGNGLDQSANGICSVYHLGARLPGRYSWQVVASNAVGSTAGPVWQFGVAPAVPGTLTVSPVGSTRANLAWVLSSDDPAYVDGYRIYTDGALAGTVARGVNTFQVANLMCNTAHSFYVTATWAGSESGGSNAAGFTTPTCPPALLTPEQGSTVPTLRPTFTWQAVGEAAGYTIQVSPHADFSTLTVNASVTGTSYTAAADLLANTLYYWRARSTGPTGAGDWSPMRSFTTGSPPSTPMLRSPAGNALVYDYTPLLDWLHSSFPTGTALDHYRVQVNTSTNFGAPLYDQTTTESKFSLPADLLPNARYYWRVRTYNTMGQYSSWGGPWAFRTAILPPQLTEPTTGAQLLTRRVDLDWGDVAGASSYLVQLSADSAFGTLLQSATASTSAYSVPSDLPANSLLYWRVQANGSNGPSLWSPVGGFTTGNPPSVPILYSPASGALLTAYQPTFNWSDSVLPAGSTLDHYLVQLATDSAFSSLLYSQSRGGSRFPLSAPLAPDARYYWRVRAFATDGHYSSWSVTKSFRTAVLPPVLSSPADGSQLPSLRLRFDWTDVASAEGYNLRISHLADFSTIHYSASTAGSSYTINIDLPASTTLYWQVQAKAANGPSLWSTAWSFKTGNPPSQPVLVSPINDASLTSYQVTLDWSDSTLPAGTALRYYRVQLATDRSFAAPLHDLTTTVSSCPLPAALTPNTVYFWRVRAVNTLGHYSKWSTIWSFRAAMLPPALLRPARGATLSSQRPFFDWQDVNGATSYTIEVSRYPGFSNKLLSVSVNGSSYRPTTNLPTGVTLYWRVRAEGPNGPSLWAEVPARTFKIILP